jgi:hypothetical protein
MPSQEQHEKFSCLGALGLWAFWRHGKWIYTPKMGCGWRWTNVMLVKLDLDFFIDKKDCGTVTTLSE